MFQEDKIKFISNKNLYTEIMKLSDTIRKRIKFYCHLARMNNSTFNFLTIKKKEEETKRMVYSSCISQKGT